jgi:hypothetical protein
MSVMISLLLAATAPSAPSARPLLSEADRALVMAPVDALFAGLATRDDKAILAQVRTEGGATVVVERPGGLRTVRRMNWADFTAGFTAGSEKLEERMRAPAIAIDGDIAMVWGRYTFLTNGKIRHCGVNHFDLVREYGAWKVMNITWTQRTTGCED